MKANLLRIERRNLAVAARIKGIAAPEFGIDAVKRHRAIGGGNRRLFELQLAVLFVVITQFGKNVRLRLNQHTAKAACDNKVSQRITRLPLMRADLDEEEVLPSGEVG